MNVKFWLDDERLAPKGWTWVKNASEAISFLQMPGIVGHGDPNVGSPNFITLTHMSFDHDLADVHYTYWHAGQMMNIPTDVRDAARKESAKEMTGYDVLLWMAEHEVWPTEACYVHSHNSVGAERMVGVINRYGPYETRCHWTPFAPVEPNPEDLTDQD